ncbi:MAG: pilus assembly protein TadG-related protein [Myxococcota bacterium]|nr:pilus assembly protein TadG-related protein [Myxococcota bacterium]
MAPSRHASRQHGNVLVTTCMGMFALVSLAALAVNQTHVYDAQAKLQNAVDAAALAGVSALRDGGDSGVAIERARAVGEEFELRGARRLDVEIEESDIEVGFFDFGENGFVAVSGEETVPAVRIDITLKGQSEPGNTGALPLYLGGLMQSITGSSVARVTSSATAVVRPRDFVILQDITYSFVEDFEYARDADLAFVDLLENSYGGLGDRVGVVTFAREAYTALDLTPIATGYEEISDYLAYDMEVCRNTSQQSGPDEINCRGSGTADGIDKAIELFEDSSSLGSDRVLVLVTDGRPCHLELGLPEAIEMGEELALDAALRASELGINIFVVEFSEPTPGNSHPCMQPNADFNTALADGYGYGVTTEDPAELGEKLGRVAKKLPVRLVD